MRARRVGVVLLVALTCVLTLVSALALWLRALVLNTDSYVRAIGPVLDHAEVRDALAEAVVAALYDHVDVTAELRAALPERAAAFAPTLAASIRTTSVQLASSALSTSAARRAWKNANRIAHDQLVHVLEGKGEIVTTAKGEVAIDTGALASAVVHSLDANGIHVFDSVPIERLDARFVLFRSTDLARAQTATRILDALATWLPIAAVASGVGALAASGHRRRMAAVLAIAVAGVMVVVVVGAAIGRSYYLAHVGASHRTIAAAPFDALVAPLRAGARWAFVAALAALAVIWFAGSAALVAQERRVRTYVVGLARREARAFAIAGASIAALVLVAWDRPRPLVVGSTLAVLVVWEVLCLAAGRTGPGPRGPAGPTGPPAPAG